MESKQSTGGINYYIIAIIIILMLIYTVANYYEPEDKSKLDFFKVTHILGFAAAAVFSFAVAKKFWISKNVFRQAYLSLGIAYTFNFIGDVLWFFSQTVLHIKNPYPYYPDIAFVLFYPFVIWHLRKNISNFQDKLDIKQKLILIVIPVSFVILYTIFSLIPMDPSGGISHLKILPIPQHDSEFYKDFFVALTYVAATSVVFAYALVGAQVFRNSILGSAWGLILVGLSLNTFADIVYYYGQFLSLDYIARHSPAFTMYVGASIIICYALYLHRKI